MKNTFFFFFFAFMGIQSISAQTAGNTGAVGHNGGSCACTGAFCSAEKQCSVRGYSCTCTCTAFHCTCSDCSTSKRPIDNVVVTEQHIANRKEFVTLLRSMNDPNATMSANLIEEAYTALLVERNFETYVAKGQQAVETVAALPPANKAVVNAWLTSVGSEHQF
jgi:hypothetical protein